MPVPLAFRPEDVNLEWETVQAINEARLLAFSGEVAAFVSKIRVCPFFFKHVPGYSPAEHLALQSKVEDRQANRNGYLISGLIAGAAAVLAALVTQGK